MAQEAEGCGYRNLIVKQHSSDNEGHRTRAKDMDTVISSWNESKDDFQNIATKYANGIRWYAAEGFE